MTASTKAPASVRVWDGLVRGLHWALVASVAVAAASLIDALGLQNWHRPAGYVALAVVCLRVVWGFAGRDYARFAQFVRAPGATLNYLRLLLQGREPRMLGHNPLGAWMILLLIMLVGALALTGYLYTTDWFWGSERLEQLHLGLAWLLLLAVVAHLLGVVFTSLRHRENLPLAMLTGRKRADLQDEAKG